MHSTPRTLPADVSRALQEDIRSGDVTADLISATQTGRAVLMTREAMVVAGLPYATAVMRSIFSVKAAATKSQKNLILNY